MHSIESVTNEELQLVGELCKKLEYNEKKEMAKADVESYISRYEICTARWICQAFADVKKEKEEILSQAGLEKIFQHMRLVLLDELYQAFHDVEKSSASGTATIKERDTQRGFTTKQQQCMLCIFG